jgi:predicted RNA-binding Zn-ribbon protein involved in translation (DUF1610 family)
MFKQKTKHPTQTITESIAQATRIHAQTVQLDCPGCNQKTLQLIKHTEGKDGFETEMHCGNCGFKGVVNSTGFEVQIPKKAKG